MIPLLEPAIGICRFSFCGKGDWRSSRGATTPDEIDAMRALNAETLYASGRMALRFYLFENFLLPSLRAQSDKNYVCLVLTSDIMPAPYLSRLRTLCGDHPNLELVVSSETSVHAAIWPRLSELNDAAGRPLVNFRIDDDDCLSHDYVNELRRYMMRLGDIIPVGYSRSNGLVITKYAADDAMFVYQAHLPFNSMGTAIRVHDERTIFSFGHNALHKRFPAVVDNSGMGYISIKIDGHDSEPISMAMAHIRNSHVPVDAARAEVILSKWFAFLAEGGEPHYAALVRKIERAAELSQHSSAAVAHAAAKI
ncbi:glycosyltransferase [Sulfitobacter guttiformis]|uniref:Putative rhamnosyltransferase n=1 Tax=Sulfitobacter guttiformis TaxID=74349 RepID=A0A420DP01_9RHOB|nr:glycosyltransferase [Sulfitobacter guttiformis]KIN73346.1 Rhamno transf domain containing protein [Sulfitobacter guttiformis KCTC 32187]RKE96014.1 putative rhamnosyltransferase [Sulfitobacter guttiformis]